MPGFVSTLASTLSSAALAVAGDRSAGMRGAPCFRGPLAPHARGVAVAPSCAVAALLRARCVPRVAADTGAQVPHSPAVELPFAAWLQRYCEWVGAARNAPASRCAAWSLDPSVGFPASRAVALQTLPAVRPTAHRHRPSRHAGIAAPGEAVAGRTRRDCPRMVLRALYYRAG